MFVLEGRITEVGVRKEQGWYSGESTRLPSPDPGSIPGFGVRCGLADFIVGSRPCFERFFSG